MIVAVRGERVADPCPEPGTALVTVSVSVFFGLLMGVLVRMWMRARVRWCGGVVGADEGSHKINVSA